MLSHITPVVLTFNEAPNISRVLDRLSWATDIVIVDSGSYEKLRARQFAPHPSLLVAVHR